MTKSSFWSSIATVESGDFTLPFLLPTFLANFKIAQNSKLFLKFPSSLPAKSVWILILWVFAFLTFPDELQRGRFLGRLRRGLGRRRLAPVVAAAAKHGSAVGFLIDRIVPGVVGRQLPQPRLVRPGPRRRRHGRLAAQGRPVTRQERRGWVRGGREGHAGLAERTVGPRGGCEGDVVGPDP